MGYLGFLDGSEGLTTAAAGSYDLPLVALSVLVACLGAFSTFAFSAQITASATALTRFGWLVLGALAMGSGVWAMHFVGMLAFVLPYPVSYEPVLTLLSMVPAALAGGAMLAVVSRPRVTGWQVGLGGLLMGAGIGVMHYSGMAAMDMDGGSMLYDPWWFAASIVVAVLLATLAVWVKTRTRRSGAIGLQLGAAAVMGSAVAGMHYTAMGATWFFHAHAAAAGQGAGLDPRSLAITVLSISTAIIAVLFAATAIGRRLEAQAAAASARAELVDAIETISDGFVIFDAAGRLTTVNSVFRSMYPDMAARLERGTRYEDFIRAWASRPGAVPEGADIEQLVGENMRLLSAEGAVDGEWHTGNRWLFVKERQTESGGIVGVWSDITRFKTLQNSLERMANYDALTGLPNRNLFHDRLDRAAGRAKRRGGCFALMYIDLDGFKPVNDAHGHEAGDAVLQEVGRRLAGSVREVDTVARMGGDEFAIILEGPVTAEAAESAARRMLAALAEPILAVGATCAVGASIGISLCPDDTAEHEELIKLADAAMYRVKAWGRNGICFHGGEPFRPATARPKAAGTA